MKFSDKQKIKPNLLIMSSKRIVCQNVENQHKLYYRVKW